MAYGVNLHHLETTASSDTQITSTDYYVNEGLGPNQPTSERSTVIHLLGQTRTVLYIVRTHNITILVNAW